MCKDSKALPPLSLSISHLSLPPTCFLLLVNTLLGTRKHLSNHSPYIFYFPPLL